jgi:mannose-6-phosphate isomerase-like protein (cupin superfamily)
VVVRDVSGTPLREVKVTITGRGEMVTDSAGVAAITLADGTYRLHFEREGLITLEREVTIRNGQPVEIDVVLNLAPVPPEPEPPPPPPEPAAPPPPPPVTAGPPASVSITAFLDKNFIGREPLKESVLGCTPGATTRLLQLRDPLAAHTHDSLDEIVYVIAGDGAVRIGNEVITVAAGSLTVIPRGLQHAIERRGRNPLILLSTLAGAPCPAGVTASPSLK